MFAIVSQSFAFELTAVEETRRTAFDSPEDAAPEHLVAEIGRGNREAESVFYAQYHRGLVLMLERRTGDRARAEDLAQDALLTVLERLRSSGIDHPERLEDQRLEVEQTLNDMREMADREAGYTGG